jgi:trk system potassium uptake protein TrkA
MFVLVTGAGRVGASVAREALDSGHTVSVLDKDALSHERLDQGMETTWEESGGRFTVGAALETAALIAAGIEEADVFVAATGGDNTNLVVAQIAEKRFEVARVISRVLDPARAEWYGQRGGIETICGTRRAIDMVSSSILSPDGGN